MPCFLRGTLVRTPDGEREVGALSIGDLLLTHSGRAKAIKWIGRRRITSEQQEWPEQAVPVMIAKDALEAGVPHKDLYVSEAHALYVDGLLIQAGSLVNGRTIVRRVPEGVTDLEYYQIELFDHDVIFADGAPTETYLESNNRDGFDNCAEYEALYGARPGGNVVPFAPTVSVAMRRRHMQSRLRSALAPWIDTRQPFDKVRDRLEDRALSLAANG